MKKILLTIVLALPILSSAVAQDSVKKDTAWKAGGLFAFTIAQTGFSNWAAGGEDSYSGNARVELFANYIKGKTAWENDLDLGYGRSQQGDFGMRKTDDFIELNSKYGLKASSKIYYTVVLNAKTQFDAGYIYSTDTLPDIHTSKFFAPLYINLALGADYKPDEYTSIFISPVNLKNIYVSDVMFAQRYSIDSAKHLRTDVGAIIKIKYKRQIIENINFLTKLDLFANYLEFKEPKDIDVNWEILITMNVFKVLSVNLNTHLIWDKDVKYVEPDGSLGNARVQFKEIFGAGIAYKF